jgi:hypothetical protein
VPCTIGVRDKCLPATTCCALNSCRSHKKAEGGGGWKIEFRKTNIVCNFLIALMFISVVSDSSVGIATRYGLDGLEIESWWGGEIFRTRPDRPWGPTPTSCTMGTGSLSGGKAAGAWLGPPTSSARVKERVELYLYSPSGPSWPVLR